MLDTLKKRKSNEANINQQLYNAIYNKITRRNHKHKSPQEGDGTIMDCIGFFENRADPEMLTKLEESLREQIELEKSPEKQGEYQKYYKYYIENFLPALKTKVMASSELFKLSVFNKKAEQTQGPKTRGGEIVGKILEIISIGNNIIGDHNNKDPENSGTNSKKELEKPIETPLPSDGPGSRASSPVPSEKSPPSSPISSRRGSISSVSSSVGGDDEIPNSLNAPPEEIRKKYDEVMKELMEHKRKPEPNRNEDQPPKLDPEEKPKKQENENSEPTKQPNNRNFRVALVTGCALSAIGCLIAGVVTLGMVGAGLLVMSVVLAIAAAVTRYLTPPSSELTSTDLSPLIDDSKQR
ncbi:MAG: hypothetical protein LBC34_03700 [Rickettsiales bacterium]|jgi:hypothetical protein|nr:hypothetical protein [Rickettsiales bacterium]